MLTRQEYFKLLRQIAGEFQRSKGSKPYDMNWKGSSADFSNFCEQKYGFRPLMSHDGAGWSQDYKITHEGKYNLFLLSR